MADAAIRAAVPADVDAIRSLVQAAFAPHVPRLGGRLPAPMEADYAALVAADPPPRSGGGCDPSLVHVFEGADSGLRGVLVSRRESDHLLVQTVAVLPACQGTGVGRRLLQYAEILARRRGLTEMRLYTAAVMTENLALYRRCGWIETGRAAPTGIPRVYLSKSLA